jgi:ATP-binding cassette subfamily F protein 3
LISVENLTVEFGAKPLFSNATFVINDKERVALVGKNGAGKSTLLKILAGLQKPTAGNVVKSNDLTLGYLPQVMKLTDTKTLIQETETAFAHVAEMETELTRVNHELAVRTDYESEIYGTLIERSTHLTERLNLMGAQNRRAEMERALMGLGFERTDFDRPTKEFSGGWRMRVELAKLLLKNPDVLLLDEPTNHLDIESIQWLETYLQGHANAVFLVSHDRAFINNVTERTLEISCGQMVDYKVKYNDYVNLRALRRESQIRAYENQQKEINDLKDFIEKFRYKPTKAVQVQSRIKQLEKIVPIEIDEVDTSALHLKFPVCSRSGDFPVICDNVRKDYGAHTIFSHVNLTIRRGEKVAFVGKNGEGKSTLVKCIMNQIPFTGTLKVGHNVQIGYYAQNQAQLLDDEPTVYDTIDQVATGDVRTKIRDILGAFMFGGEASDKKVKVLSGGERSRLAMIQLLLKPVNLLILDEPTNHLDMRTKDILKEAIRDFGGTVIIVSHDRDFLDGLVTKVYEFGGGKVTPFLGGIYDFLQKKKMESLTELEQQHQPVEQTEKIAEPSEGKLSYEQQKELRKRLRTAEKNVGESEKQISDLEAAIHLIEDRMSTPEGAEDVTLVNKHGKLSQQLDTAMQEWENWSQQLEGLQKEA